MELSALPPPTNGPWPAELIFLRAANRDRLRVRLSEVTQHAATEPLLRVARRYADSSEPGPVSLAIVATSSEDLLQKLNRVAAIIDAEASRRHESAGIHLTLAPMAAEGRVAFVFPGQGSQYLNMLRDLVEHFPRARAPFELFDRELAGWFDRPLSRFIFAEPSDTDEEQRRQAELTNTSVAQPALGAANLALYNVLLDFGVRPSLVAGHSYGEFVALHAAGCFDEPTLARLSASRGRFMSEVAGARTGSMAVVDAGAEVLRPLLADTGVTLANLNAPRQTVISGSHEDVEVATARCSSHGLRVRGLAVACAFHSPLVAPAQRRLAAVLSDTAIESPRLPIYSNLTAEAYPNDQNEVVQLASAQLAQPVEWIREVEAMYRDGARIFVEVGPKSVLGGLISRILADRPHLVVSLDQPGRNGVFQLLNSLATLAAEGVSLDPDSLTRPH